MVEGVFDVTPLLTLKEINNSQDEMSYITRMRNIIKFQIASNEDYGYYQKAGFYSELTCHKTHESLLEACLSHALKTVVKYHVVVHNLELFRQWDIISIDVDGFPVIRRENVEDKAEEYIQRNLFLVAAFSYSERHEFGSDWYTYYACNRRLFTDIHLDDRQISDADYLSFLGKSSWRRLNDNNLSFFSCSEKDIAAYVKEQTKMSKPINVFKQILNREWGEHFDEFEVLKSIAAPYYFVLPHQNKAEYKMFESLSSWYQKRTSSEYITFRFKSCLIIGEKTII
ncbi:UNVERIFIED_CONTAM: hypothetical protein NCL1_20329 [Trichonephila clavipes]